MRENPDLLLRHDRAVQEARPATQILIDVMFVGVAAVEMTIVPSRATELGEYQTRHGTDLYHAATRLSTNPEANSLGRNPIGFAVGKGIG